MDPTKYLPKQENEALLKFPAYISLLAANSDDKPDEAEKRSAIQCSHVKTFSSGTLLEEFYKEADRVFENNIEQLDKALPLEKNQRDAAIKMELSKFEKIVLKLGADYTQAMHRSMKSFTDHVSKAHHSVFVDFIFPMPIKGLSF